MNPGASFACTIRELAKQHHASPCTFRICALDFIASLSKPVTEETTVAMMVQVIRTDSNNPPREIARRVGELVEIRLGAKPHISAKPKLAGWQRGKGAVDAF